MAVSALSRQSEDKYIRQAYQRRQDELYFHNKACAELEQAKQALVEKDAIIAELQARLASK
ncbi:MAG: hypothetical protein FWC89_09310 [Defluviitaleaceae bacterium]|nr:hypothetical protein [Defluviitaleaceae bacterium]